MILEEQIEKMKNVCNCKHGKYYSDSGCVHFGCALKKNHICKNCKEWEMADICNIEYPPVQ